jgi:glucokinase
VYLGIEIGGTKLQLGVGSGTGGRLETLERADVDQAKGAQGIREQIASIAPPMVRQYGIQNVGIGFGGPVNAVTGRIIKSFQIEGWDDFPLCDWSRQTLGLPASLENDSNLAGLGEARFGAGKEARVVVYSNVGSGIGGALVVGGELYVGGGGGAVAEIGHLRPGLDARSPQQTVESFASGWGMAEQLRVRLRQANAKEKDASEQLRTLCSGEIDRLTGKMVVEAAAAGNTLAAEVFGQALQTYGWALAQAVTLLAPNVIVIGGGIAQIGDSQFFAPLRAEVERYVIAPLRGTCEIVPAALGEEVVIHGAIAIAADEAKQNA